MEQQKTKEKELEVLWKSQHPFKPSVSPLRKSVNSNISERDDKHFKAKNIDIALQRHLKNTYDMETGQQFFVPRIASLKPEVIRKAYQARYDYELDDKARVVDKRLHAVFKFFSLGKPTIKIQDLDLLFLKNECIVLMRDLLLKLIQGKNNLSYSEFINTVLEGGLIPVIDKTYDYIKGKPISSKSPMKVSKSPKRTPTTYEKQITKAIQKEMSKSTVIPKQDEKFKKARVTQNYTNLIK